MAREAFFETIYHRNDWNLADAFRPQPGWGSRCFRVPAFRVGECSEAEMIEGAKEAAPRDYRLTSLTHYPEVGPERVIWSTPPDQRFAAANWAAITKTEGAPHATPA